MIKVIGFVQNKTRFVDTLSASVFTSTIDSLWLKQHNWKRRKSRYYFTKCKLVCFKVSQIMAGTCFHQLCWEETQESRQCSQSEGRSEKAVFNLSLEEFLSSFYHFQSISFLLNSNQLSMIVTMKYSFWFHFHLCLVSQWVGRRESSFVFKIRRRKSLVPKL